MSCSVKRKLVPCSSAPVSAARETAQKAGCRFRLHFRARCFQSNCRSRWQSLSGPMGSATLLSTRGSVARYAKRVSILKARNLPGASLVNGTATLASTARWLAGRPFPHVIGMAQASQHPGTSTKERRERWTPLEQDGKPRTSYHAMLPRTDAEPGVFGHKLLVTRCLQKMVARGGIEPPFKCKNLPKMRGSMI
jgi:hypothetical protein